eukprot:6466777-Amphidinium_carterae.1
MERVGCGDVVGNKGVRESLANIWTELKIAALSLNAFYKLLVADYRRYGMALMSKRRELTEHMHALQGNERADAVLNTMKVLPSWLETLRKDSLTEIIPVFLNAANSVITDLEAATTLDSIKKLSDEEGCKLQETCQKVAQAMAAASALLKNWAEVTTVASLTQRSEAVLPKVQQSLRLAKATAALLPWTKDGCLPADVSGLVITQESIAKLTSTFSGHSFDGVEQLLPMLEVVFIVVSKT